MQPVLQYQWRGEHVDKDRKVKGGKGGKAAWWKASWKEAKWKLREKSDFLVYDWLFSLFISDIFVNMKTRSQMNFDDHDEGDAVSSLQVEIVAYSHFFQTILSPNRTIFFPA